MPWTYDAPPAVATNWTDGQIRRCVDAANAVLDETGDEAQAIYACIHAAGKGQAAMREYKSVKAVTLGIDGRTVTGIFAVHGNVDDGDGWSSRDRSHPGLFGDFMADGRKRAVFLWQHCAMEPPIATIDQLFEVSLVDLPPAVKAYAPDTTGGVAVRRTYLETMRGNEVLAGITSGAITEMSYSYEAKRWDFEQQDEPAAGIPIRNLYEAELYDVSDVNWGMNPATSADGSKGQPLHIEHDMALAAVSRYITRLKGLAALRAKEGRAISAENQRRIEACMASLMDAHAMLQELMDSADMGKRKTDMRRLLLETQRTLAALNGVPTR